MTAPSELDEVARVAAGLTSLGLRPVLVGGMALVLLGSRRITRDFDFVIPRPEGRLDELIELFYERGFELASKVDPAGDIVATIDNPRVASIRLRLDAPASAYFWHLTKRLRIDLLFDFPVVATELASRARDVTIRGRVFHIAAEADLLRMKKIARRDRSFPGDAEDIKFLETRRGTRK